QRQVETALAFFSGTFFVHAIFQPDAAVVLQIKEITESAAVGGNEASILETIAVSGSGTGKCGNSDARVETIAKLGLCSQEVAVAVSTIVIATHHHVTPQFGIHVKRNL